MSPQPSDGSPHPPMPEPLRDRPAVPVPVLAGLVALVAVLLYLNALQNPFVYDDYRLIVENASILDLGDLRGVLYRDVTRPLVNVSFALDAAIWGMRPFGFHLTSVLLHAVNAALVLWVAWFAAEDRRRQRQLLPSTASSRAIATATALLFAVHPLMTQAVGYISGRSEVLYAALFLSALLSARRWMLHGGRRWWLLTVGLWVLGILAKETAVMLGPLLFCYDYFVLGGDAAEKRRRLRRLHLPLLLIALLAATVRVGLLTTIEYPSQGSVDPRFALVSIGVVWRYLAMLAAARNQSIFHEIPAVVDPFAPGVVAAVVSLAAVLALAWRFRWVHSVLALGVFWFVLLLVPSGVLFALGRGEPMAEHRAYGASIGVFLAVGSAFGMLARRSERKGRAAAWGIYGLSALFVTQLAGRTVLRNTVWNDPVALGREAVNLAPEHWIPRLLLGEAFRQSGRCGEAIAEYRTAIDLHPEEEFGHLKLAACLITQRRLNEALAAFRRLEAVSPASSQAATGRGLVHILLGHEPEARAALLEALGRSPSSPLAIELLALVDGRLAPAEAAALCSSLAGLSADAAIGCS